MPAFKERMGDSHLILRGPQDGRGTGLDVYRCHFPSDRLFCVGTLRLFVFDFFIIVNRLLLLASQYIALPPSMRRN